MNSTFVFHRSITHSLNQLKEGFPEKIWITHAKYFILKRMFSDLQTIQNKNLNLIFSFRIWFLNEIFIKKSQCNNEHQNAEVVKR
jgi:hypothetical protein